MFSTVGGCPRGSRGGGRECPGGCGLDVSRDVLPPCRASRRDSSTTLKEESSPRRLELEWSRVSNYTASLSTADLQEFGISKHLIAAAFLSILRTASESCCASLEGKKKLPVEIFLPFSKGPIPRGSWQ